MKKATGWTWSDLDVQHLDLIADLISATEEFDNTPIRTTRAEISSYFSDEYKWRAQGAWINGELAAFGLARTIIDGSGSYTVRLSGSVNSRYRAKGLGAELLDRQVSVAQELVEQLPPASSQALLYVEADHKNILRLAQLHGFERQATFVQVRGTTTASLHGPALSEYITIEAMQDELSDEIRQIHNVVVSQSQVFESLTAQSWAQLLADVDREWCLVAIDRFGDRPKVVGYLLASVFVSVVDGQETSDAYIDEVVVTEQYRNSGVGSALINTALAHFTDGGYPAVVADVAVTDPEGTPFSDVFAQHQFVELGRTHVMSRKLS